jgi:hypothetical protein
MELVNYLYSWYTNEEQTTWYRQQSEESAEILSATEEVTPAVAPEPAPIKRGRKPKTK